MKENPEKFSPEAVESMRQYFKIKDDTAAVHQMNRSPSKNDECKYNFDLNDSIKRMAISKCTADDGREFMNRNCSTNDDITVKNGNCIEKKVRFDTDSC